MSQYLLPCECGQKLAVSTTQAGERLHCTCGRQLEVPTLRGLQALERRDDTAAKPELASWGWRQGLAFLGAAIFVLASLALVVLQITKPPSREQAFMDARPETIDFNALSPAGAWFLWRRVQIGVQRPLTVGEVQAMLGASAMLATWDQWRKMAGIFAGMGLALVIICFPWAAWPLTVRRGAGPRGVRQNLLDLDCSATDPAGVKPTARS